MASVNAPKGLLLAKKVGSGTNSTGINTVQVTDYTVASALLPSNLFTGDPIRIDPAGTVVPTSVTANKKIGGVFQGISYKNADGEQKFSRHFTGGTTATDVKVFIADDPDQTFFIQADATVTASTYSGYNSMNAAMLAGSGGSTITGNSSYVLDASSLAITQQQLRVIRRAPWDTGESATGKTDQYPWYEVRINMHFDNFITTTISVS